MGYHVFIGESKARGFTLVSVQVGNADVSQARNVMRSLLLRGQERIHFHSERDARVLSEAGRERGRSKALSFEIRPPRLDPGLWIADAFAWVHNRRGDWLRRVAMHPSEQIHVG
jgi:hypothetical protein